MEGSRPPPSLQPEPAHFHLLILFKIGFCRFQLKIHQSGLTLFTPPRPESNRDEELFEEEYSGKASWEDRVQVDLSAVPRHTDWCPVGGVRTIWNGVPAVNPHLWLSF